MVDKPGTKILQAELERRDRARAASLNADREEHCHSDEGYGNYPDSYPDYEHEVTYPDT